MTRVLTSLAFALAAISTSRVAAEEKFDQSTFGLTYVRPPGDGPTCASVEWGLVYPPQPIEGASLVINVTAVDTPADAIIRVSACNSTTNPTLVNASDPTTWLAVVSGRCANFWLNDTETPLNCSHSKVTIERSLLTDYCERSPSAEVCDSSKTPSGKTVPAPSSATLQATEVWMVGATAVTVMAISLVDF